ncbi:MAG: STAS domain-containing protein [Acidobacteria bacterium]|nr:STAS domain-containing protein [Acidobacteriota bacterium]MSO61226.1 STAS domain-containing protein [Acidobacteriota bacterium]
MKSGLPAWLPRSVLTLSEGYDRAALAADLIAGVTVGLVALPLAMAFAIASGLTPQAGIYCAIITGFIISALGGSRFQVGGPTGAFVVVVSGIVAKYGIDGLFMCTLMAGVILVVMGLAGTGTAVKYIPKPVIIGFANGIALVIASTQVKDFLGLEIAVPGEFIERLEVIGANLGSVSPDSLALGAATLLLLVLWSRYVKRIPAYIVALFAGTGAAFVFQLDVATVGSRFGGIPPGLPAFHVPVFRPELVLTLISPALTVAMLGAIESLLSAVVADRMGGDRHNPNTELFAQGVANILSPMFGGLPATGALARTATNIRAGARSPMSGIIHAVTLLGVLLFGARLAAYVPLPVLAAILFVVAWNMGEWLEIGEVFKQSYADILVWTATFMLTVLADLTVAVEVGMVLAALLFIRRVANTTTVSRVTHAYVEAGRPHILQDKVISDYVAIFRIHGPFLFGGTDKLHEISDRADELPRVVVLRLRNMTAVDATGLSAIEELADELKAKGRTLVLCGAPSQPLAAMWKAEFHARLSEANICANVQAALDRAAAVVGEL